MVQGGHRASRLRSFLGKGWPDGWRDQISVRANNPWEGAKQNTARSPHSLPVVARQKGEDDRVCACRKASRVTYPQVSTCLAGVSRGTQDHGALLSPPP